MSFQCYAYRDTDWHAICADLDIAADGKSLEEVVETLEICIGMYLDTVAELPPAERRHFLTRRAPWRVRASLAVSAWLHRVKGAGERRMRSFSLESHLVAPS